MPVGIGCEREIESCISSDFALARAQPCCPLALGSYAFPLPLARDLSNCLLAADRLFFLASIDLDELCTDSLTALDISSLTLPPLRPSQADVAKTSSVDAFVAPNQVNAPQSSLILSAHELSEFVVDIGGILLPKKRAIVASLPQSSSGTSTSALSSFGALVPVQSAVGALRSIALALCRGGPVLCTGVSGSGKSTLLHEVARLTGNEDMVQIHLDDQIDSKVSWSWVTWD